MYQKGHVCSICGERLDSYDSFSIRFTDDKDVVVCTECDFKLSDSECGRVQE
jgi:DNA-directed RNA polymerase subunit RPC12/RpoP